MAQMTYAQAIQYVIDNGMPVKGQEDEVFNDACGRLEALKGQLAKRNSSGALKKPTKTQRENEILKGQILDMLGEEVDGMTASEIASALAVHVQKASALLSQLTPERGDGRVRRVKEGKVTRFVLA